jgi:hypothetical protein
LINYFSSAINFCKEFKYALNTSVSLSSPSLSRKNQAMMWTALRLVRARWASDRIESRKFFARRLLVVWGGGGSQEGRKRQRKEGDLWGGLELMAKLLWEGWLKSDSEERLETHERQCGVLQEIDKGRGERSDRGERRNLGCGVDWANRKVRWRQQIEDDRFEGRQEEGRGQRVSVQEE